MFSRNACVSVCVCVCDSNNVLRNDNINTAKYIKVRGKTFIFTEKKGNSGYSNKNLLISSFSMYKDCRTSVTENSLNSGIMDK